MGTNMLKLNGPNIHFISFNMYARVHHTLVYIQKHTNITKIFRKHFQFVRLKK